MNRKEMIDIPQLETAIRAYPSVMQTQWKTEELKRRKEKNNNNKTGKEEEEEEEDAKQRH